MAEQANLPQNYTQQKIMSALRELMVPSNPRQIAKTAGVSVQTAYTHLPILVSEGWIEKMPNMTGRGGILYQIHGGMGYQATIFHKGTYFSLLSFVERAAKNGLPDNPIERNLHLAIIQLFKMAVDAVDDYNPVPMSSTQVKEISRTVAMTKKKAQELKELGDALLNFSRLWDPKEIPKMLVMEDHDVDIEKVRELLGRIFDST